jgi:hypothetical protein
MAKRSRALISGDLGGSQNCAGILLDVFLGLNYHYA